MTARRYGTVLLGITLFLLAGCAASSQFLDERQLKGCYDVDGKIAIGGRVSNTVSQLDATGIILTGGMTPAECLELRGMFRERALPFE